MQVHEDRYMKKCGVPENWLFLYVVQVWAREDVCQM
jgi:hypothetical protein